MTSPVELPIVGKFKKTALSKEELLEFWQQVLRRVAFNFRQGEKVEQIEKGSDGIFAVTSSKGRHRTRAVVLAIGKSGSPRKLGVKGEHLPKVMYRLIEADHYVNKRVLVVGGGDSAVEVAMGLAYQSGNSVTLSYRQGEFSRIKERNSQRLAECIRKGKLEVIFNSNPVEFAPDAVLLDIKGTTQKIPNDYVWIFAGDEPPTAFLKKIGIAIGPQDLAPKVSKEMQERDLVPV